MSTVGWSPERWEGLIEAGWNPEDYEALYSEDRSAMVGNAICSLLERLYLTPEPEPAPMTRAGYAEYLHGWHWYETRQRALLRSGRQCQHCYAEDRRLDVHHMTYARLGHEAEADLVVLCSVCHAAVHGRSPAFRPAP